MIKNHLKRSIPGLGARLVELRRRHGLSQAVTGVRSGVSCGVLVSAERFDLASTATLNKLAPALGVSVDALIGRVALPPPPKSTEAV